MAVANTAHPLSMYSCWSMFDGRARLTVDRKCRILSECQIAKHMLELGNDIILRDDCLATVDPETTAALTHAVRTVTNEVQTIIIKRLDGDGDLVLRVSASPRATDVVCIMAQGTGSDFHQEFVDLRAAFPLTRCEAMITEHILQGRAPDEIARLTGTSIATVRCHIKRVHEKLKVHSREELFKVTAPYRFR
jgi:DNA-binding CsgD family transcriptional regulator